MRRGYHATLESWRQSPFFQQLPTDQARAASIRFARWCRDLALVFERHGEARSREIIDQMRPDLFSEGIWNELGVLETWVAARRDDDRDGRLTAGWVTQSWEYVLSSEAGRRARLALDGQTDPLREVTSVDTDFAARFGPQLAPSPPQPPANSGTHSAVSEQPPTPPPASGGQQPVTQLTGQTSSANDGDESQPPSSNEDGRAGLNNTAGHAALSQTTGADLLPPLLRNLVVTTNTVSNNPDAMACPKSK
jgi:hypothetical protein